ncbi:N/A [soil metagenome]
MAKLLLTAALVLLGRGALADDAETIREIVRAEQQRLQIPGLTVAVSRGGELILNESFGAEVTAESVYQLGSIGKQWTAAGIIRLIERGELQLHDRVVKFFPEAHSSWSEVRVSHLLHQTSGIREFFTIPEVAKALTDHTRAPDELLQHILRQPLGFAPGSRWSYSNSNYTLLAAIIEQLTEGPYEQFLAREFFEPLGLQSMHHCENQPTRPEIATGYEMRKGKPVPAEIENMNWARGDGGLCGTAADLVKWAQSFPYEKLIPQERLAPYGYGVSLVPLDEKVPKIAHNGAIGGFMSTLAWYPDQQVAIAVLTNRSRIWPQVIEKRIVRALLALPAPDFTAKPIPQVQLRRYTGTYDIGVTGLPLRLLARRGQLRLEAAPPIPSGDLRHIGDGRFVATDEPDTIQLQFTGPQGGPAERLQLLMAGMHWDGRRVPAAK